MIWAPPHEEEVVEGSSSMDVAIPDQNDGAVFRIREYMFSTKIGLCCQSRLRIRGIYEGRKRGMRS